MSIEIYSRGVVHCSVCVPKDMPREEVEQRVNAENPTGLDHGWRVSDEPTFSNGMPNPNECEGRNGYLHYLMVC